MIFDIILKSAFVIDGTGEDGKVLDIAIKDGVIAKIAPEISEQAKETHNLVGYTLTPGFVDIHRHGDAYAINGKFGETELRQGITTIVNGNCGFSLAPCPKEEVGNYYPYLKALTGELNFDENYPTMAEYIKKVNSVPQRVNVGTLVGSGTIRVAAMGYENRPLTDTEIEKVKALIDEALTAGALGVSLGMIYVPETFYKTEEYKKIFAELSKHDTVITSHLRGEGDLLLSAIDEVMEISRLAKTRLHISHFKAAGKNNWGETMQRAMDKMTASKAEGHDVTCDVYPYSGASTTLVSLLPFEYQSGGINETIKRLQNPEIRKEITIKLATPRCNFDNILCSVGWGAVVIGSCASGNKEIVGKSVLDIAKARGIDPYDCAYDLIIEEQGTVTMLYFCMSEEDMRHALAWDNSAVISDALYSDGALPHPRMYGSFTRVLEEYVKKHKVLTLPNAIKKMTSYPCQILRIPNKGIIKEGYDADIAVFKLDEIKDNSDYYNPRQLGTGFKIILVGGEIASYEDKLTDVYNGKFVKSISPSKN